MSASIEQQSRLDSWMLVDSPLRYREVRGILRMRPAVGCQRSDRTNCRSRNQHRLPAAPHCRSCTVSLPTRRSLLPAPRSLTLTGLFPCQLVPAAPEASRLNLQPKPAPARVLPVMLPCVA